MGKVKIQGFGDRIKQLCDGRGISVRTAEVELGFANGYFLAIDKHGSCPSAKRLRMIADYFGVTQEYLLGEDSPDGTAGVMIPLLIVAMLLVCPVFFDLGALRMVQFLLPPTYYINGVYNTRYILYMAVYTLGCGSLYWLWGRSFHRH